MTAFYATRLTIIDISNPLSPKIVSSLGDWTNLAFPVDVAVQGGYAYVADQISHRSAACNSRRGRLEPGQARSVVGVAGQQRAERRLPAPGAGQLRLRLGELRGHCRRRSTSPTRSARASPARSPTPRTCNKTTGLDLDSTGRYVIATSPYLSTQSQPRLPAVPAPDRAVRRSPERSRRSTSTRRADLGRDRTASEPPNPTTQNSAQLRVLDQRLGLDRAVQARRRRRSASAPAPTSAAVQLTRRRQPHLHGPGHRLGREYDHVASYTLDRQRAAPVNTVAADDLGVGGAGSDR